MQTKHKIIIDNSQNLSSIESNSVNLVVTSPPYPMIKMWDSVFSSMNPNITDELINSNGKLAFELMHQELDKVWSELYRVVCDGGFVCINIGDATRTTENFNLFSNSSRITSSFYELGFTNLPPIIWSKTTNSPTKFMGSGMLPAGAYVTLENEFILIFRKGSNRKFTESQKNKRHKSAYFWSERNIWFSSFWKVSGTRQKTVNGEKRERNAAYPIEIPWRLINMFSIYDDVVLDPFLGTGTTSLAAMLAGRNSLGVEIEKSILNSFGKNINHLKEMSSNIVSSRLNHQIDFVNYREKKPIYYNEDLGVPVITSQEKKISFYQVDDVKKIKQDYRVSYRKFTKKKSLFDL